MNILLRLAILPAAFLCGKGLAAWRQTAGQDANSGAGSLGIPNGLLEALERKQPDPDWARVMSLASRFKVSAARALNQVLALLVADHLSPGLHR